MTLQTLAPPLVLSLWQQAGTQGLHPHLGGRVLSEVGVASEGGTTNASANLLVLQAELAAESMT